MPRRKKVAKSNKNWLVASAVIILIVLFAATMLMSNGQGGTNETPMQEEKQSTVISSGDFCVRDSQCFSAGCKSTSTVFDCVNSTTQELYYKNCKTYWDVNVVQDISRCACVQGKCTAVR